MKRFLFALIACVCSCLVAAQTLYEMRFFDKVEGGVLNALFVKSDDKNCYVRCVDDKPNADGDYNYWHHNYFCQYQKNDDGNTIWFLPSPDKDSEYEVDVQYPAFSLAYSSNGEFESTMFFSYFDDEKESYNDFRECKMFSEINLLEKDDDYFLSYFNADEPMYASIINARRLLASQGQTVVEPVADVNVGGGSALLSAGPVFHFIAIAATNDATIGASVATDLSLVRKQFSSIASTIGMTFDEQIISGANFSKSNVESVIGSLNVSPSDVIVFVYSGHGFRFDDDTDEYPEMYLRYSGGLEGNDYLGVTDVYNRLIGKKANFTLMLTDCCNSKYGATRAEIEAATFQTRAVSSNTDVNKLKKLFSQSGSVRATAAKPGQYALCDASGGFLITSVLNNIQSQVSALSQNEPSWTTIMDNASSYVKKKTSNQIDEAGNDKEPQIVVRSVKIQK